MALPEQGDHPVLSDGVLGLGHWRILMVMNSNVQISSKGTCKHLLWCLWFHSIKKKWISLDKRTKLPSVCWFLFYLDVN